MKFRYFVSASLIPLCLALGSCGSDAEEASSTVSSSTSNIGEASSIADSSESSSVIEQSSSVVTAEPIESSSETQRAYDIAVAMKNVELSNYIEPGSDHNSLGLRYDGLWNLNEDDIQWQQPKNASENPNGSIKPGTWYRAMAECVSAFYTSQNYQDDFLDDYGSSLPTMFGISEDSSQATVQHYMDKVKDFFDESNCEAAMLQSFQNLDSADTDYDLNECSYHISFNNLTDTASEIGITEKALGYSLAVFAEDDADISFDNNACTVDCSGDAISEKMGASITDFEIDAADESYYQTMSINNNHALWRFDDGWIYGLGFDNNGSSEFIKIRSDLTDATCLRKKCTPYNITILDGYIYALIVDYQYGDVDKDGNGISNLFRVRLGGTQGKTILKHIESYCISNGKIYYTSLDDDLNKRYLRCCNLDGTNSEVVLKEAVYFPYVINDTLLCQLDNIDGDKQGEKIYAVNLKTGARDELTWERSYAPVLYEGYLYYLRNENDRESGNEDEPLKLARANLTFGDEEVLLDECTNYWIENDQIYYLDKKDKNRLYAMNLDGSNIHLIIQDAYITIAGHYIGPNGILYATTNSSYSSYKNIKVCDTDGTDAQDITQYLCVE